MDVIDSDLDGRGVASTFPAPGWFGVVVGILEDGSYYAVEELVSGEGHIIWIEADAIGDYLLA